MKHFLFWEKTVGSLKPLTDLDFECKDNTFLPKNTIKNVTIVFIFVS